MRRLQAWTREEIIAYNLRDGGTAVTIFEDAQNDRVTRARRMIGTILTRMGGDARRLIVEPGCSSGDISGFFSIEHDVVGYDVVPAAVEATRSRWPSMLVTREVAEDVVPFRCDILVLCEFLEHIDDPVTFVQTWLPLARYVVIGHPLVGDGFDPEQGHVWAYYPDDFERWFAMGGHRMAAMTIFPMGYEMVMGWGQR